MWDLHVGTHCNATSSLEKQRILLGAHPNRSTICNRYVLSDPLPPRKKGGREDWDAEFPISAEAFRRQGHGVRPPWGSVASLPRLEFGHHAASLGEAFCVSLGFILGRRIVRGTGRIAMRRYMVCGALRVSGNQLKSGGRDE
jgi:hypothetical protein